MGFGLLNLNSVHFWTFNVLPTKKKLVNWVQTSHVGWKTPIIPGIVPVQLQFIGRTSLVFWKLSSEGSYRHLGQQYANEGISPSSSKHMQCNTGKFHQMQTTPKKFIFFHANKVTNLEQGYVHRIHVLNCRMVKVISAGRGLKAGSTCSTGCDQIRQKSARFYCPGSR